METLTPQPQPIQTRTKLTWDEAHKALLKFSKILIKPYTVKDLAKIYNVSPPTFRKMLAPHNPTIGMRDGAYYTIPQVKLILKLVDKPTEQTNVTLAKVYDVSLPTFREWMDRKKDSLGKMFGNNYTQRQIFLIVNELEYPCLEGDEIDILEVFLRLCGAIPAKESGNVAA